VDELFDRLWTNTDDLDRRTAREVLDGRYRWLEQGVVDPSGEGPWTADASPGPSRRPDVHRSLR